MSVVRLGRARQGLGAALAVVTVIGGSSGTASAASSGSPAWTTGYAIVCAGADQGGSVLWDADLLENQVLGMLSPTPYPPPDPPGQPGCHYPPSTTYADGSLPVGSAAAYIVNPDGSFSASASAKGGTQADGEKALSFAEDYAGLPISGGQRGIEVLLSLGLSLSPTQYTPAPAAPASGSLVYPDMARSDLQVSAGPQDGGQCSDGSRPTAAYDQGQYGSVSVTSDAPVSALAYRATFTCPQGATITASTVYVAIWVDVAANSYNLTSKSATASVGVPAVTVNDIS